MIVKSYKRCIYLRQIKVNPNPKQSNACTFERFSVSKVISKNNKPNTRFGLLFFGAGNRT